MMQVQTAGSSTLTMAYARPASPTLTDPGMILPYGFGYDEPSSPLRDPYHSNLTLAGLAGTWSSAPNMADLQYAQHAQLSPVSPSTPIIYGNGTMLSDIGEVTEAETTPKKLPGPAERRMLKQREVLLKQQQALTSLQSPTTTAHNSFAKHSKISAHERRISTDSVSTLASKENDEGLFDSFDDDDGASVDDSNYADEESLAESYVAESYSEELAAIEARRYSGISDGEGNSSAALSRRAEEILLNAKKRLNNMEGNLSRARSSLIIAPPRMSLTSIHSSSPLFRTTPSPPTQGNTTSLHRQSSASSLLSHGNTTLHRQSSASSLLSLGNTPSLHRQVSSSSLLSQPGSAGSGHFRINSENGLPSPVRASPASTRFPVRSASASSAYVGRNRLGAGGLILSPLHNAHPIIESVEQEESSSSSSPPRSKAATPIIRTSPPRDARLESLDENGTPEFDSDRHSIKSFDSNMEEHRGLTRSASSHQMRDLQDQMDAMKGRLSVLRDRAADDRMKRRSMQNLRTPSPFTAAEQWYNSDKSSDEDGINLDAENGQRPWHEEESGYGQRAMDSSPSSGSHPRHNVQEPYSEVASIYEDVSEGLGIIGVTTSDEKAIEIMEDEVPEDETDETGLARVEEIYEDDYNDEIVYHDELNDYESDASSQYHDARDHQVSHEDREDAFDYEHFFLHSALGTISQQRTRRGSYSSDDSVETTRGPPVSTKQNNRVSLGHSRMDSSDSVSTLATFATAKSALSRQQSFVSTKSEDSDGGAKESFPVTSPLPSPMPSPILERRVSAPVLPSPTPMTAKRSTFGPAVQSNFQKAEQTRRASVLHSPKLRDAYQDATGNRAFADSIDSVGSGNSFGSSGTARSFPLINEVSPGLFGQPRHSSAPNESIRSTPRSSIIEHSSQSPILLPKDDQALVERLVASLGKCVLALQEADPDSHDSRIWRRRLDAARRVLEGEEGAV